VRLADALGRATLARYDRPKHDDGGHILEYVFGAVA
jgi:hypothetical protein